MTSKLHTYIFSSLLIISVIFLISLDCYSQDSNFRLRNLTVEKTKQRKWQKHPIKREIELGQKLKIIKYSSDSVICGDFMSLTDSSIQLNESTIFIKDIKRLNIIKSSKLLFYGLGISALSVGLIAYSLTIPSQGAVQFVIAGYALIGLIGIMIGIPTTLYGLIRIGAAGEYHFDKNWRLYINN